jgi:MFS family permease
VTARAEAVALPPLRRQREFLKLWAGQSISVFGDSVTLLALPLTAVLTLGASAGQMGLLTAAGLAPHLLLSLHAGAWIDRRHRRRWILVAADLGRAALIATVPLAAAVDALTLTHVYVVAFAVGVLTVFFDVGYMSLLALVVPRRDFVEANAKLSLSRSASWIGGQPLAGGLVQLLTAPFALLADALSFLLSGSFIGRIRVEERPLEEQPARIREQLREGFGFVLGQPLMRAKLGCAATINLFNFVFHAIFVLYATRELGVGPGLLGLVLGAGAVGAAIGALIAPRVERRIGIGPSILVGSILFPAPLLLVPAAGGPFTLVLALLFASEFLAGIGVMLFDVSGGSLSLFLTPQRLLARATGTYRFVNYGIRPIGALLGGALGSAIGLRPTLWLATAGALLGVVWLVFSPLPRLREQPAEAL